MLELRMWIFFLIPVINVNYINGNWELMSLLKENHQEMYINIVIIIKFQVKAL